MERAGLTDDELLSRAERAGWEWFHQVHDRWPGSEKYPATGWLKDAGFQHCSPVDKVDALRAKVNIANEHLGFDHHFDCSECGRPIWLGWATYVEEELVERRECWTCNFWLSRLRIADKSMIVVTTGPKFYSIGPRTTPSRNNGFGGDTWTVEFIDGRVIETCDLWFGGDIPDRFKDRFPVNATLTSDRRKP